jgi:hypothetical protein
VVRSGDTVTTFPKAELHLKMVDGAFISVRESSKLTITSYVANGDDHDESLIDLAHGVLRSITGWIGKNHREAYKVRTPMVTIGIRGTDHEASHLLPGDPRGEPGSYDKVNEGGTVMQSPRGTVEVAPNRAAFFHRDRPGPPRLLASVPNFFRPARNEQRFLERAHASVRTLDAQREQRREALRKQRGEPPRKPAPQRALEKRKPAAKAGVLRQDKGGERRFEKKDGPRRELKGERPRREFKAERPRRERGAKHER